MRRNSPFSFLSIKYQNMIFYKNNLELCTPELFSPTNFPKRVSNKPKRNWQQIMHVKRGKKRKSKDLQICIYVKRETIFFYSNQSIFSWFEISAFHRSCDVMRLPFDQIIFYFRLFVFIVVNGEIDMQSWTHYAEPKKKQNKKTRKTRRKRKMKRRKKGKTKHYRRDLNGKLQLKICSVPFNLSKEWNLFFFSKKCCKRAARYLFWNWYQQINKIGI